MNFSQATLLLIAVYMCFTLYIVYKGATKTKNIKEFALGNGFSPVVVGLSLAASITSAATFIINPGFVALYGWSAFLAMSIVLPLGLFISLIILSKSFRKYGSSIKALTLAQWVGKRYDSPFFSVLMAFFSLLLLTFIALICVGLTKVLSSALGADELLVLVCLVIFVFGYTMFGGANSMIYTNAIQAILMVIVAVILLTSGFEHFNGGWDAFWAKLDTIDPNMSLSFNEKSPLFRDWFEVIFCNFIVGIAIVCQPHIITRSLMLKSDEDVNKYLAVAILVETLFFFVLFAGFYARIMFPDLLNEGTPLKMDGILSAYVVKKFSVAIGITVIMGLIAAGLSTLEGIVQSLSTTITNDIIAPFTGLDENSKKLPVINKLVIVVIAIIAIVISYQQLLYPNLSVGILAQNGVYAFFSAAFVPVLFGIFVKDMPKQAAIGAAVTAMIVHFSVYYGQLTPYTTGSIRNPAVAATIAILSAVFVGIALWVILRKKMNTQTEP
ncbi:MAG: sodium:solute symporter [Saprospiraceae bacterium]|nr:sodium:solute symporter [Saprospiraceae bacterium]